MRGHDREEMGTHAGAEPGAGKLDDCGIVCRCGVDMSVCMCVDAYRLDDNSIGPAGAAALASSLGSLTSLRSLSYVVSGVVRG